MSGKKHQSLECSPKHHNPCWWIWSKSHLPLQWWCLAEKTNCRAPVSSPGRTVTPPVSEQVTFESRLWAGDSSRQQVPHVPGMLGSLAFPQKYFQPQTHRDFSLPSAEIRSFALPQLWVAAPHTTFFIMFVLSDRCLDWRTLLGQAGLWRGREVQ